MLWEVVSSWALVVRYPHFTGRFCIRTMIPPGLHGSILDKAVGWIFACSSPSSARDFLGR